MSKDGWKGGDHRGGLSPDTDHEDQHPINQTHFIQLQYQEDLGEKFVSGSFRWNLTKTGHQSPQSCHVFGCLPFFHLWSTMSCFLLCVNQFFMNSHCCGLVLLMTLTVSMCKSGNVKRCCPNRFLGLFPAPEHQQLRAQSVLLVQVHLVLHGQQLFSKNYFTTVTPEWNQSSLIRPEIGSSGWSAVSPGPPQLSVLSGSRFNPYGGPSGQQNSGIPVPPPDHVPELRILDQVMVKPTTQPRWLTHCCCLGLFGFIWTVPHVHLRDSHTHTDRQTQGWWSSNDGAGSFITIIYLTYMAGLTKNTADVLMLMWRAEAGLFNDASHMF